MARLADVTLPRRRRWRLHPALVAGLALFVAIVALAPRAFAADPLSGVALVIGNGDYAHLPALANPGDDADAVEELLSDLGFDSVRRTDRDAEDLARDLDRFVEDAAEADVAVLYYAGHGIEAGGENFLVPVDADLSALEAASERLVPLSAVLARLRETVPVTILLLNACRDNPFPPGATLRLAAGAEPLPISAGGLAETRGAKALSAPAAGEAENLGMVIGFAAEPGKPALDGQPGEHSPYAAALTRHLAAMAGEEFGTVMRMVAEEVYLKTSGRQRPWVNESLRRLLFFGEAPAPLAGEEGEILAERRQLLLTIAELPDPEFRRHQAERIAADGGVPLDAVYGMLRAMGADAPQDPAELEKALLAEAERFATFLAEREAINSPDPEIVRLTMLADDAEREGLLSSAERFRERAKARYLELEATLEEQEEALRQRFIEGAAVFARSAETKALASDHLAAAADYAEAFRRVENRDRRLAWYYKDAELRAMTNHGDDKGDNAALERAIAAGMRALALISRESSPLDWARTQNNLAAALSTLGKRESGTARMEDAVRAYRQALFEASRERVPVDWATIQHNLGSVLLNLGERESGTARLEQAVEAFRAALEELTRERVPLDWAQTQSNLGNALQTLGERESGTARLEQAVEAYHAALEELTRENAPLGWASTQNNLGTVLVTVGRREGGTVRLEDAVEAFRQALLERTRERVPLEWAATQANLGNALWILGASESGTARLEQAVEALRQALLERTRERVPIDWARTQNNLGNALRTLGVRESDLARMEKATEAYRQALLELTRERVPLDWAQTQSNLGLALQALGERESRTVRLEQAVDAYHQALLELTRERVPLDWAATQNNLGLALQTLGERESGTARLEQAIETYREALLERTRQRVPLDWAQTQYNLGNALSSLGGRENGTARLEMAVEAYRAALLERTRDRVPLGWAVTQYNLGNVLSALADRVEARKGVPYLEDAIDAFRQVQLQATREQEPDFWAGLQNAIGYSLVMIGEIEDNMARFEEAVPILREALAVENQLASVSAYYTADSLCRALLNIGRRREDRTVLLEAKELCAFSLAGLTKADAAAAREAAGNLERVEAALAALG